VQDCDFMVYSYGMSCLDTFTTYTFKAVFMAVSAGPFRPQKFSARLLLL